MNALLLTGQRSIEYVTSLFPLLTRELTEQAARKRTFVLRVIYAVILYGFTFIMLWEEMSRWAGQSFAFMGRGKDLFATLARLQFYGLYLFLPAMACGVLTSEKERDTLSLLMLSRLGGWSIILGKLFSRLIPMASFILLSVPLVAVAYSLGGVEQGDILNLAWGLMITALQVGSLAVACSAWFRTTASAFMGTYLIGVLLISGPFFLTQGGSQDSSGIVESIRLSIDQLGLSGTHRFGEEEVVSMFSGIWACLHPSAVGLPFPIIVLRTIPMATFAACCLIFARVVIWRRAFVQPSNLMLKMLRAIDGIFHRLNQNRVTRGIIILRDNTALPLYEPIRWRETNKRSLGTTRYLIRLLLLLEVPLMFGMLIPLGAGSDNHFSVHASPWFLWIAATLVLVIQSTGLIGAERSRQTLDVLLTTPLDSEQIVREKFAGIWRMIRMLWIPFATVYLFQIYWISYVVSSHSAAFFALRGLLATAIYPPLIAWVGFHFSMRCRTQTQATLATLGLICGISIGPLLLAFFLGGPGLSLIYWISPAAVIMAGGLEELYTQMTYEVSLIPWVLVHFVFAGLALVLLRYLGLGMFAKYVNRNDGQIVDDDGIEQMSALRQHLQLTGRLRRKDREEP